MAVFKIIASRPQKIKDFEHHPEFDVEIISGDLNQDDRFVLWETCHPFEVIVRKIAKSDVVTLSISCPVSYEGWHVGTIVDTTDPEAGREYGYRTRDAKRLYHPEVLKKTNSDEEDKSLGLAGKSLLKPCADAEPRAGSEAKEKMRGNALWRRLPRSIFRALRAALKPDHPDGN